MLGKRVATKEDGFLPNLTEPGSYGRATAKRVQGTFASWWNVVAPDGSVVELNPAIHQVNEHDDGTITVWPSIVTRSWHGWLIGGVWKEHRPRQ